MIVSAEEVRADLIARREIALIDLREEAAFAQAHPLFAAQMPLSRIELEVLDRIPRRETRIVVYDDDGDLVDRGMARLKGLGYTNVGRLADGLSGWRKAGFELFQDVNSYSKAFGELVEHRRHTPSLSATEVRALIDGGENMVILDARRFDEYQTMSIPGGISVPGAELVMRASTLAPDPATRIIVNCAGRTRSLIGTQSLINAGLPNRIDALRNGTIGWLLAGLELDKGQSRRFADVDPATLAKAREHSREVAYRAGVRYLDTAGLERILADSHRTTYRFDVRTPEEYSAGHLAGFRNAPGGQLVQETDVFAPVRGARIVLTDNLGPRADMTASWLAQLGWDTYILDSVGATELGPWRPTYPALPEPDSISAEALAAKLARNEIVVVDLAPSKAHAKGHIPGAWFAIRDALHQPIEGLSAKDGLVITSPDGALARLAAVDIENALGCVVQTLQGGTEAWVAAGYPLEAGMLRTASEPVDIYKRPYENTDNSEAAMQAYLDWEYGLVDQLQRDGTHGFYVI